ncbi:tol-pal system protein YbgF [Thauera mechernichensis]|uniref:Cell division coordinator CpoB n=1 Tax=Thauera mechernichensis TaxID=82788 RepID=A0ABW3W8V9_9RHOO|nr:tol-pal system protein YbgF [Thauera mechernichensis]MDG3064192.1 tol-pal system protein YbgF [Thauera mechernichensis]
MKRLLPLAASLALVAATPAHAQLFGGDTEARNQIIQLRQDVQGQLETAGRGQLELAMQNEQLRAEVARLRGQIELLMNEVETLKQRQRDFYVDLDARLRQIETGGGAPGVAASGDPAAESADYQAALGLLKDGKQKDALAAFETFVTRYPAGGFTAGAHFWAGNAALQARDVAAATKHFNAVLQKWPNDDVAPDAMLGLANSQQALGDAAATRRTLQGLVERYPQSNAAQVARQRLNAR